MKKEEIWQQAIEETQNNYAALRFASNAIIDPFFQ